VGSLLWVSSCEGLHLAGTNCLGMLCDCKRRIMTPLGRLHRELDPPPLYKQNHECKRLDDIKWPKHKRVHLCTNKLNYMINSNTGENSPAGLPLNLVTQNQNYINHNSSVKQ